MFRIYLYFFLVILLSILESNSLTLAEQEPKFLDKNITNKILDGKKMRIFTQSVSSENDITRTNGNLFIVNNIGIINARSATFHKLENTFNIDNGLKIRTNQSIILFARSIHYNNKISTGILSNAHLFFNDNSSMLTNKLEKVSESEYNMSDATFSACHINNISEISAERQRNEMQYANTQNILNPLNLNTVLNNSYENVNNQYNKLPWSMQADKINVNLDTNLLTAKNMRLKIFGLTMFKKSNFKYDISGNGKSGFLIPRLIVLGTRQVGLAMPFYLRFGTNSDLTITPIVHQALDNVFQQKSRTGTMDSRRIREDYINILGRHLFYEGNENRSDGILYYNGSITNNTNLIDNRTRNYRYDKDGNIIIGNRWHIDLDTNFGISQNTFVKGKMLKSSDPNYLMIYHLKGDMYSRNYLGIFHGQENQYHSAEIIKFDPLLTYISPTTTPIAMPFIRSIYELPIKDSKYGRFILNQRYANLQRSSGFHSQVYNNQLGYYLPIKTMDSLYLNIFGNYNMNYQKSKYLGFKSADDGYVNNFAAITPTNPEFYNQSYNRTLYYGKFVNPSDFHTNRNYYNLTFDLSRPMLTSVGRYGNFIIEPRIKYFNTQNKNIAGMPLEDSLANAINSSNLFSNSISSGYGILDSGRRLSYGINLYTQFPWHNINGSFGIGVLNYLSQPNVFYDQRYGLNKNLSDYVGNAKIYNQYFELSHEYRIDSNRDASVVSGIFAPTVRVTNLSITNPTGLSGGIMYSTIDTFPVGANGKLDTLSPNLQYSFANGFIIAFTGAKVIKSNKDNNTTQSAWLRRGVSIMKQSNCLFYGVSAMENNYLIPGVANGVIIRFNFGVKGL